MTLADASLRLQHRTTVARRSGRVVATAVVAALLVAQWVLRSWGPMPASFDVGLAEQVNRVQSWVRTNRNDNFWLAHVLRPIGDFVLAFYEGLLDLLLWLPWYWLPLAVLAVVLRSGRVVSAVGAFAGLLYVELAGLHEQGMQTVALMGICVVLCVVIGLPLGIWAGLSPRVERVLRPVLDALQSLPTTIYLVPAVLFFGIKQVPAAVATVAFGVPPMIRIAALGIRGVPEASVEAGRTFGSTSWQLLWKVQVPQAVRSFVTAVNQTIMMCLGMVVIGALVGAGGLGGELMQTLKLRSPGRGFLVGLAIFAIAVAFDRLSRSVIDRAAPLPVPGRPYWATVGVVLVVSLVVGRLATWQSSPWTFDRGIAEPIDRLITDIRDSWQGGLQTVNDFVVRDLVIRFRDLVLDGIAWPVLLAGTAALSWWLRGWRLAVFSVVGLLGVGWLGMWAPSVETFAQIVFSVLLAVLVSIPLGIFVGRRPRLKGVLEPFLDALQTLPSLVYAIPFVMVFAVGYVPGLLATVLYAIPPGVRLTALAIEQVDGETLEAATTFGATPRQRLWGVHVPLATRGIALAVNQVVMMSLSMVIIAGLIGGQGLGYQAVAALTKPDTGLGVEAGVAMLVMAILLDRMGEGVADRLDRSR